MKQQDQSQSNIMTLKINFLQLLISVVDKIILCKRLPRHRGCLPQLQIVLLREEVPIDHDHRVRK